MQMLRDFCLQLTINRMQGPFATEPFRPLFAQPLFSYKQSKLRFDTNRATGTYYYKINRCCFCDNGIDSDLNEYEWNSYNLLVIVEDYWRRWQVGVVRTSRLESYPNLDWGIVLHTFFWLDLPLSRMKTRESFIVLLRQPSTNRAIFTDWLDHSSSRLKYFVETFVQLTFLKVNWGFHVKILTN